MANQEEQTGWRDELLGVARRNWRPSVIAVLLIVGGTELLVQIGVTDDRAFSAVMWIGLAGWLLFVALKEPRAGGRRTKVSDRS